MQTKFHLWLARIISHEENALAILNGPALKWAAVAAALVMGLPILQQVPGITVAYICLVLVGVDVQYIKCWIQALDAQTRTARILWSIVAGLLFIPVVQTNAVYGLHAQTGIDELSAMNIIHLSPIGWAIERAFLIALLMGVSAISRPKAHHTPIAVAPAPAPSPAPPAPERPTGKRTPRRDTGRTVQETNALKRRIAPQVIALAAQKTPRREIARRLDITAFMVREILNDSKQQKGAA